MMGTEGFCVISKPNPGQSAHAWLVVVFIISAFSCLELYVSERRKVFPQEVI